MSCHFYNFFALPYAVFSPAQHGLQLCRLVFPTLAKQLRVGRTTTESACLWNIYELCPLALDQGPKRQLTEINVDPLGSGKDGVTAPTMASKPLHV
ncbi:hypothetical protein ACLKA6_013844 [Drosophila palustris]